MTERKLSNQLYLYNSYYLIKEYNLWKKYHITCVIKGLKSKLLPDKTELKCDKKTFSLVVKKFLNENNPVSQVFPELYCISGGPGSGKNFFYNWKRCSGKLPPNSVVHDPDLIMISIPEYLLDYKIDPGEAFKKWELTARYIANYIAIKAAKFRYNIVYIRTMALADSLNFISELRNKLGYSIKTNLLMCDLDVAYARIINREINKKHYLPNEIFYERHNNIKKNFNTIKILSNRFMIWQNSIDNCLPVKIHFCSQTDVEKFYKM